MQLGCSSGLVYRVVPDSGVGCDRMRDALPSTCLYAVGILCCVTNWYVSMSTVTITVVRRLCGNIDHGIVGEPVDTIHTIYAGVILYPSKEAPRRKMCAKASFLESVFFAPRQFSLCHLLREVC